LREFIERLLATLNNAYDFLAQRCFKDSSLFHFFKSFFQSYELFLIFRNVPLIVKMLSTIFRPLGGSLIELRCLVNA